MNLSNRIIVSPVILISGILMVGFGFTGIDFAIAHDHWSRNMDRTTTFPLLGNMSVVDAFLISMIATAMGFLLVIVGSHLAITNARMIKSMVKIVGGVALVAWAIWGYAFAFNTIEDKLTIRGEDHVDIPCPAFEVGEPVCRFTSTEWLFINFGMAALGAILTMWGAAQARVVRIYRRV